MFIHDEIVRAVDLQVRGYELLKWLERAFAGSMIGSRSTGILPAAAKAIHDALRRGSEISEIVWHVKKRFDRSDEAGGSPEP